MMKRSLLYIMGVVCLMTSCAEESFEPVTPTPGKDVVFAIGAKSNPITRTLYGPEVSGTDSDSFADSTQIYWVHGDAISVYGASCLAGRKQAEYAVSTAELDENGNETSVINTTQNYASLLKKTGDTGVQWGNTGTSNFYALYPSSNAVSFDDNGVIKASISATQNYVFELGSNTTTVTENDTKHTVQIWEGSHFGSDATNPSMQNAIMFARTENASSSDDAVNLHFKPFATVLKMRFLGFLSSLSTDTKAYVQSITITAPYAIAGDFTFETSGSLDKAAAVVTSSENTSNSITVNTILPGGGFLPLENLQAVEFNVFTIPSEGVKMSATDLWTVSVQVQGYQPFTYQMKPKTDGAEYTLEPAKIHKVQIPQYTSLTSEPWDPSKWITQIPTPVYISELSVPGAWYCFDSGYQETTDLATLYKAGVRAFNIDCRITKKGDTNDGKYVLGTTYEEEWSDSDYPTNAYLACAGTEKNDNGQAGAIVPKGYYNLTDGTYVETAVKGLVSLAKNNPSEYIVIVFSFAEKPKTINYTTTQVYGSVNPTLIMNELYKILDTSGIKEYLYTGITPDTTIEDITKEQSDGYVKNVIVKINHCIDNFYENQSYLSYNHDNNEETPNQSILPSGIMGSFGSISSNSTYNTDSDIITNIAGIHSETKYAKYFTTMQTDDIYNGSESTNMTYCYHHAQNTSSDTKQGVEGTGIPSLGMRMDAIDDIIDQSKTVYDNAQHDHWFQMGIGGSIDGDNPSGVTSVLNPYLYGKIMKKMDTDPSPVGIVLMNHATSTTKYTITVDGTEYKDVTSQDLVQAIIEMNGKFYLNRKGNDVITGDSNNSTSGTTVPASNGAYALVGDDAF